MVHISFTSGEVLDIMSALHSKATDAELIGEHHLAAYYLNMIQQFEMIYDKLQELPGECRVANLILAQN
jgi:hypothetical protein